MTDHYYFTAAQLSKLLEPINPKRVSQNRDGKSHVEAYEIRAHLNRILGFARWSADLVELVPLFEEIAPHPRDEKKGTVVSVGYRATMCLRVCAPDGGLLASYTEAAAGDASNFPLSKRADAHDFAMKTAESQALKRCAVNLGDQFGLSLYKKGSTAPLVSRTLIGGPAPEKQGEGSGVGVPNIDGHITETPPENETPDPPVDRKQRSEPAPPAAEPVTGKVEELRQRVLDLPADLTARAAMAGLMAVQIDAAKVSAMKAEVADRNGEVTTLGAFIESEIKARQKAA